MSKTYTQQAKSNYLTLPLKELKIDDHSKYVERSQIECLKDLIFNLVTCTPTNQSHLGDKFREYKKIKFKTPDPFLTDIFSRVGIKQANLFLFKNYSTRTKTEKNEKKNLYKKVINCHKEMLCLHCDDGGVINSLYNAIRNALAHGNIVKQNDYTLLYSVNIARKGDNEYESNVTFFMRIKNIEKLMAFQNVLESYR